MIKNYFIIFTLGIAIGSLEAGKGGKQKYNLTKSSTKETSSDSKLKNFTPKGSPQRAVLTVKSPATYVSFPTLDQKEEINPNFVPEENKTPIYATPLKGSSKENTPPRHCQQQDDIYITCAATSSSAVYTSPDSPHRYETIGEKSSPENSPVRPTTTKKTTTKSPAVQSLIAALHNLPLSKNN